MKTRFALNKEEATHRYPTAMHFGNGYFDDGFKYLVADSVIAALDFPKAIPTGNMMLMQVCIDGVWGFIEHHKVMLKGIMSIYIKQHKFKNGDRLVLHINKEHHNGYKTKVNLEVFYGTSCYDGTFSYSGNEFFNLSRMYDAIRCFDLRKKRLYPDLAISFGDNLDIFFEKENTHDYPRGLGAILADAIERRKTMGTGE